MVNLPPIPKIPETEELEFKEKEFFLTLYEQYQATSKIWFFVLLGILLVAIPGGIFLNRGLTSYFINHYQPPAVNTHPYSAQDLQIVKVVYFPVAPGTVAAYAQIRNPNLDLAAAEIDYEFQFQDPTGQTIKSVAGQSFAQAAESKYLILPSVGIASQPAAVNLVLTKTQWTKRQPAFDVKLNFTRENTGITPEGKFFVEGEVRNLQTYQIRRVEVNVLVFDKTTQNLIAVNASYLTDLFPLESRYIRILWPTAAFASAVGDVQVIPYINLLEPGLILQTQKIPPR